MAREAKRYSLLAEYAAANGYPQLKADTAQSWTRLGLIPKVQVDHVGFQLRALSEPVWGGRLLLRACHYRYEWRIRDIAQVGALVWIDGFPVADALIRRGLLRVAEAPVRLLQVTSPRESGHREPMEERIEAAAVRVVYDKHFDERLAGDQRRVRKADLTEGLANLVGMLVLPDAKPTDQLAEIGRVMGLEALDFAKAFPPIAPRLRPDALATRIRDAQPAELEEARGRALILLGEAPPTHPAVRIITVVTFLAIGDLAHSG